jgi:hypothetical protein
MPSFAKDTAKDVADMICRGLIVQRLPHREACELFAAQCAQFPHTNWQKRNEAARQARTLPIET